MFFTENETEKNRDILEQIEYLIRTKIEEYTEALRNAEKVPLPQISNTILENDLDESLCDYLREHVYDRVNNPNNLPYSKLIETVTAEEIKERVDLVDEETGDKCYDMLKVEDYESIIKFMRCTLHNEEIEEKEADLEEYQELQTLYSIFDLAKMLFVSRFLRWHHI